MVGALSPPETVAAVPISQRRVSRAWTRLPVVASLVFSVVFVTRTIATGHDGVLFTLFDDAMISMRYARNLAHGHGLVWNAGRPPVEGYTNFLWTVLMAVTHLVPLPDRLASLPVMAIGAVLLAAEVVLCGVLARRLSAPHSRVPVAVCWVVALYYPLTAWTLRGMEVGAEAVIVTGAAILALRLRDEPSARSAVWLGVLLGAGVLTRDDFAVLAVIVLGFVAISVDPAARRRCVVAAALPVAVMAAAQTVFRAAYYGALLPNTYYLKVSGVPATVRVHRGAVTLVIMLALHLGVPALFAAAYFVTHRRRVPAGAWLLASCVVAATAYMVAVGADAWEWTLYSDRYLVPVVPFLLVLAVLGVQSLVQRARSAPGPDLLVALVLGALAVLFAVVATASVPDTRIAELQVPTGTAAFSRALWLLPVIAAVALALLARRARVTWTGPALVIGLVLVVSGPSVTAWWRHNAVGRAQDVAWARYGIALRRATGPDVTIAMSSAGNIAYFDHRPGVDLLGKSDRVIARDRPVYVNGYFLPGHSKRDLRYSIGRLRPDVIAELFGATPADLAALRTWGYEHVGGMTWYRRDARGVDLRALRRAAAISR